MVSIRCNSCVKYEEIKKRSARITKIRHFMSKYNWKGTNFPLENDNWKKTFRKIIKHLLSLICMLNKKKYILLMF